jgi:hypothetical protein
MRGKNEQSEATHDGEHTCSVVACALDIVRFVAILRKVGVLGYNPRHEGPEGLGLQVARRRIFEINGAVFHRLPFV